MRIPSKVKIARAATETILEELRGLSPQEWRTPNACGSWPLDVVVAHLARGAEGYEESIRRALEGLTDSPDGRGFVTDRAVASAGIRERSEAFRETLGDGVLGAYVERSFSLIELFERLEPKDWQRPAFHGVRIIPIEQLLGWRIAELSLHRWDMLTALGRTAELPDGAPEALLDWLPIWMGVSFNPGQPLVEPIRFRYSLTAAPSTTIDLTVYGDRFTWERDSSASTGVALSTDPTTFVLVLMGRRALVEAVERGEVVISGPRETALRLADWFGAL